MKYTDTLRNIVLIGALAIALTLSIYELTEAPGIWYDEGFYTQMGMNVALYGMQAVQTAPNVFAPATYITVGYPLIAPLAASYALFGVGVLEGRMVMVLFILGFILASFLFTRHLFGTPAATYTTLLLATFPMLYGNGKSVLGEVPGLFFLALSLLALFLLEKNNYRDWRLYVLLGITVGLCAVTKPLFLLLPAALTLALLLRVRTIPLYWPKILLGALSFLACLALWMLLQFGDNASLGSVLSGYANPYGSANLLLLVTENALRFFTEITPLFTLGAMIVWGTSLFLRRKMNISVAEVGAFIFCIFVILSYLRLPGWYRYLFPATLTALVFLAPSLFVIAHRLESIAARIPFVVIATAGIVLLSSAQLYQSVFDSYVASAYGSTRTDVSKEALATIPSGSSVFLYDVPELAILLPTKEYYQFIGPLPHVQIGEETLALLADGIPEYVVLATPSYEEHSELFEHYETYSVFDRYLMLVRQ